MLKLHRSRRAPGSPWASGGGPAASSAGGPPSAAHTHTHTPASAHARGQREDAARARPSAEAGGAPGGRRAPAERAGLTGGRRPRGRTAALGPRPPRAGGGRWARARGGGGEGVVRMRAPRWGPVCTEGDRCHLALRTRRWASPGDPRDVWRVLSPGWDSHRGPE